MTLVHLLLAALIAWLSLIALPSYATCGGEGPNACTGRIHYQFSGQSATANQSGSPANTATSGPARNSSVTNFDPSTAGISRTSYGLRPTLTCWVFADLDRIRQCLAVTHNLDASALWPKVVEACDRSGETGPRCGEQRMFERPAKAK